MNKLKQARKEAGFTQAQIAQKAGITVRAYQYYESGERVPNAQAAVRIAKVLNSSVEKLFSTNS